MRVKKVENVSNERVSIFTSNNMEISLPAYESYEGALDVTNLKELGEKVSYVADLTEVGSSSSKKMRLDD